MKTTPTAGPGRASTVMPLTDDFEVTGHGDAAAWRRTAWPPLKRVGGSLSYPTRAKLLYSLTGLYVLVDCADRRLTCTRLPDMGDLYREDVVEFFIWPDTRYPLYLEYEISPLDAELVILVPNRKGRFMGWRPWHYEGDRMTRHGTSVRGGRRAPGTAISGWMAEFFIPFTLFVGVADTPPKPGDTWRMNAYRIDYDAGKATQWAWCPATETNFHDYKHFGVVEFGG
jgi:hypothetical protein